MPLFFLVVGAGLIVVAIRNQTSQLVTLLKSDFTGSGNFGVWIVAIAGIGALGTIPGFKTVSNGLLVLVVLGILLSNKGFFTQFQQAVQS